MKEVITGAHVCCIHTTRQPAHSAAHAECFLGQLEIRSVKLHADPPSPFHLGSICNFRSEVGARPHGHRSMLALQHSIHPKVTNHCSRNFLHKHHTVRTSHTYQRMHAKYTSPSMDSTHTAGIIGIYVSRATKTKGYVGAYNNYIEHYPL